MSRAVLVVLILSVVASCTSAACVPGGRCGINEFWNTCASHCPPTCAEPNPTWMCIQSCRVGCDCLRGHLRASDGTCVPRSKCY